MLAPIALFVYNRPGHTEMTLNALAESELADESVLFIFSDGPRELASDEQLENIKNVRKVIRKKKWCGEVHIIEEQQNKGLADSIVGGVSKIINDYGKIIVLEDDIVVSKGFLNFMNNALNIYEAEENVMHITGFMYPNASITLPSTFFYPLPYPGGGWATWKRAWQYYNNDAKYLYQILEKNNDWVKFNSDGGTFFKDQLKRNAEGTLKTWFVRWHASITMQKGLTLFPKTSLIFNSGFDNSGENCGVYTEFNGEVADYIEVTKGPVKSSDEAGKIIRDFYKKIMPSQSAKKWSEKFTGLLKRNIPFKQTIRRIVSRVISFGVPEINILKDNKNNWNRLQNLDNDIIRGINTKIADPFMLDKVSIGDYTYIAKNADVSNTSIGKFCSIGPNLVCGFGIHPINGISTSPMFYSNLKQNGISLSSENKIEERKKIEIGNDVFVGANVTIVDGIKIGDGAVIGAGAVVVNDIPAYAIAVGCPAKVIKYRFSEKEISDLLEIQWWNFSNNKLKEVEEKFFDLEAFINSHKNV